jgi:hypothetical protein
MQHLARAIVSIMAALQFSEGKSIDAEYAVEMMEMLSLDLRRCTPEERTALAEAARREFVAHRDTGSRPEVLEFYRTFVQVFVDGVPPVEDFAP